MSAVEGLLLLGGDARRQALVALIGRVEVGQVLIDAVALAQVLGELGLRGRPAA